MELSGIGGLTWPDMVIIAVIAVSMFVGLTRGMIKTIISVLAWIAAFYIALNFYDGYSYLLKSIIESETTRHWAGGILLFITVLIIGAIIGNLLHQLIVSANIVWVNRAVGLVLGAIIGAVISAALILAVSLTSLTETEPYKNSKLIPRFVPLVEVIRDIAPEKMRGKINEPNEPF